MWFPQQILGERRAGAPLRFVTSVDPDEGFAGEMLVYDPPRVMELTWGASRLRIELYPEGEATRLVLTEVLDDLGTGARNGAGWHECLDRLTAVIEGTVPSGGAGATARSTRPTSSRSDPMPPASARPRVGRRSARRPLRPSASQHPDPNPDLRLPH